MPDPNSCPLFRPLPHDPLTLTFATHLVFTSAGFNREQRKTLTMLITDIHARYTS